MNFKARIVGFLLVIYLPIDLDEGSFWLDMLKNYMFQLGLMIYLTMITILSLSWYEITIYISQLDNIQKSIKIKSMKR